MRAPGRSTGRRQGSARTQRGDSGQPVARLGRTIPVGVSESGIGSAVAGRSVPAARDRSGAREAGETSLSGRSLASPPLDRGMSRTVSRSLQL